MRGALSYRTLFWIAASIAAIEAGLLLGRSGPYTTWHYQHRAFRVNHSTGLQEMSTERGWQPITFTR